MQNISANYQTVKKYSGLKLTTRDNNRDGSQRPNYYTKEWVYVLHYTIITDENGLKCSGSFFLNAKYDFLILGNASVIVLLGFIL